MAAIKSAVPKGVPVTTPEEILSSWGSDAVSQFSAPNGTSHVDRVTVFQNTSNSRTGKVIALPGTMAELLKAAGEAYGITGKREASAPVVFASSPGTYKFILIDPLISTFAAPNVFPVHIRNFHGDWWRGCGCHSCPRR